MSQQNTTKVLAYLPYGFSAVQKDRYINGIKKALLDCFGIQQEHSWVYLVEFTRDNACYIWAEEMSTDLYMMGNRSEDEKEKYAKQLVEVVNSLYDEGDTPLAAYATINEHSFDREYYQGDLFSLKSP